LWKARAEDTVPEADQPDDVVLVGPMVAGCSQKTEVYHMAGQWDANLEVP
jgi:hypothetical protein